MPSEKFFVHKEDGSLVRLKGRLVRFLDEEPPTGSDKSAIRTALEVSPDAEGLVQADVGTAPNEIPVNGMLGDMAYQSSEGISVGTLEVTDKIGIGTNSGSRELTIGDGTGSPNIQLLSSNSGLARIEFGDTDDGDAGELMYDHSNNKLTVNTAGSTAVTIDSSQRVGIGTSSPTTPLDIEVGSAGGAEISLNQTGTNGRDFRISSTGTGYGSAGNLVFYDATAGAERVRIDSAGKLTMASSGIKITGNATDSRSLAFTNAADTTGWSIGNGIIDSSHNFRFYDNTAGAARWTIDGSNGNLVANSTGIDFGSGATLDDYETGTWTPALSTGTGESITYAAQTGNYTKIGSLVFCTARIQINTAATYGSNNHLLITGLPFTVLDASLGMSFSYGGDYNDPSLFQVGDITGAHATANGASMFYLQRGAYGGTSDVYYRVALLNTTCYVKFTVTYRTGQ